MISFAIPTWNRAEGLRACVESIAVQNPQEIVIADDASTDETPEVCRELVKKYPFVKYHRFEDRKKFAGNFQRVVNLCNSPFIWTFGDDDKLVETSLENIKAIIKSTDFDFYHVSETIRTTKAEALQGTVCGICNTIGFLDFTGFISGNIARREKYIKAVNSENWDLYSTSSYPHSLGILESMAGSRALMLELGCVISSEGSVKTAETWVAESVCWKYLYIGDGLKKIQEMNLIPKKVSETFFRYLQGDLFSRMMPDFTARATTLPDTLNKADWDCFLHMASMVEGDRGEEIYKWIYQIRELAEANKQIFRDSALAYSKISNVATSIKFPIYPTPYLPEGESNVEC